MTGSDRADLERWAAALASVAERIRGERGVEDPWSLSVEDGVLWAHYGDLQVYLGGGAHVHDEAELFEEVDGWVAFDRRPRPRTPLPRDDAARAEWRAQLPGLRRFWEPVVARVLADVERTTAVDVTWSPELEEWQLDLEPSPGFWLAFGAQPMPVREAPFPPLQLRLPHQTFTLPVLDDVEEAAADLAGVLQDYVIEELPGAWPVCAEHAHPMQSDRTADGAVWRCPVDPGRTAVLGGLTRAG